MKGKLGEFVKRNNIDEYELSDVMYEYFFLSVFEVLHDYLLDEKNRKEFIIKLRNSSSKQGIVKDTIKEISDLILNEDEIKRLTELVIASINKKDFRETVSQYKKGKLLRKQEYKCTICNKEINSSDSHYDHIIPWSWVGDELENNYQMLCYGCNLKKGRSIIYGVKVFISKYTLDKK